MRGLLLRLVWIFRVVTVVFAVGMTAQAWHLVTSRLPRDEANTLRYQTRNGFIAVAVMVLVLAMLEALRSRFERRVADRAAIDPLPAEAWQPIRAANRIFRIVYLWILRLTWPLFLGLIGADALGLLSPPMAAADRTLFAIIGVVLLILWAFIARTKGPWTLNGGGRLEQRDQS